MNPETLRFATSVSTAFGMLGLAAIVLLYAYYRRLKNTETTLKDIPKDQRLRALDPYLTRYNVDARGISPDKTYELIRLELEKRSAGVTQLTIVIAAVFLICFTVASILQQRHSISDVEKQADVTVGDISQLFGQVNRINRVENVPRDKNSARLNEWFSKSQKNIKIVTINGQSWIKANNFNPFQEAIKRIPVTLMLLDYSDERTAGIWNDAMNEYGESTWRREQFTDNFRDYAKLLRPDGHLTLGLYQDYPWTRFTIFDDRAVSFIFTPVVHAGDTVLTYFSQDPFIVRCFEDIFARIQENAARRGHIFKDSGPAEQFAAQLQSSLLEPSGPFDLNRSVLRLDLDVYADLRKRRPMFC